MKLILALLLLPTLSSFAADLGTCRRQAERNANGSSVSYISDACVKAATSQANPQLKKLSPDLRYLVAGMENFVVIKTLALHGEKVAPPPPPHILAGQATLLNHITALAMNVKLNRLAVLENEVGKPRILVFTLNADGNTAPLQEIAQGSLARARALHFGDDSRITALDADGVQLFTHAFPK